MSFPPPQTCFLKNQSFKNFLGYYSTEQESQEQLQNFVTMAPSCGMELFLLPESL